MYPLNTDTLLRVPVRIVDVVLLEMTLKENECPASSRFDGHN